MQQIAQQQPHARSAQVTKSREYNADTSRVITWAYCLSQDQPGTLNPKNSFPRRGISSQAQPGTAGALQPYCTSPLPQRLHPALLSISCYRLSVPKNVPRLLFYSSSPCCQLHTCSFTSSPLLTALSTCKQGSQGGCSVFNQQLPLLLPPERDTAGKKPPSTTVLQSTAPLSFIPLSKHLFYCAIATQSPGRLQCLQRHRQVYPCCCQVVKA